MTPTWSSVRLSVGPVSKDGFFKQVNFRYVNVEMPRFTTFQDKDKWSFMGVRRKVINLVEGFDDRESEEKAHPQLHSPSMAVEMPHSASRITDLFSKPSN